jgi:PKD repeat protein
VTVDFGSALDGQGGPVWIRIVTVAASSGSGSRATTGIDDFSLTYSASTNTSVQFVSTTSSAAENSGTTNLALAITNFDATNATNVTISATGATGRITTFTTPVTFPANSGTNENVVVTLNNNLLCDGNQTVTFTITGVTGGQGTPTIGTNASHVLTVNDDDVCLNTSVQFVSTSSSVAENGGTTNLALAITDFDASNPTSVTISATGATGRITTFTTPVTFPANSGTNQNCVVTLDNNLLCDGNQTVTFTITGISGGQGTAFIGANASHVLTVNDDEVPSAPVATFGTSVGSANFTANWDAVGGATGYFLDVSSSSTFSFPLVELVKWDFPNGSGDQVADGGVPANVSQTISAVGTGVLSYVAGVDGTPDLAISTTAWDAGNGTKFWQIEFSTEGYTDLSVSSVQRSSNTGPRDFKIQYRIGLGGTWTDVSGGAVTVANDYTTGVVNGLALPSACDDEPSVFLRWIMTSNTAVGGAAVASTGTSRMDDLVISGSEPAMVPGYDNLSVGNVLTFPVTGLSPLTIYYYRVRSIGGCSTGGNSNTISVTTNAVADYYSRASGNVNDPIWSETPTGTAGPALWTGASTMNVQAGHTVTNTSSETVGSVNVEGTLVLADGSVLTLNGDEFFSIGTITAEDNSELALFGENVLVSLLDVPSFYDIRVNNSSVAVVDEPIRVRGTLFVEAGEIEAQGAQGIILHSDVNGTGRLGPLDVTTTYTGNLTVERYIPAGSTNWRLLGSPVAGAIVANWEDDFVTAGYPGSQFPTFQNPPNSGILWPSIRWYDETALDASSDTGLVGVSSDQQALSAGQGFAAWSGDNFSTTTDFTIELTGTPHVAVTPITLPMSWSDNGTPAADGWNLVSNPLPSPIDFTQISRGADVANQYYIYDPAAGNNVAWTNGVGQGGANGTIQSSQGFWLKADGTDIVTTVDENAKVLAPTGGVFGGDQTPNRPMLRLRLTNGQNSFRDESLIVFDEGSPELNDIDAVKLVFAHPQAPQLATRATDGTSLAIDFHGAYTQAITIPVTVKAGVNGTYTITADLLGITSLSCLSLEDLETGTITPLTNGASYTFTLNATAAPVDRFVLRGSAPLGFEANDATCGGADNGEATVEVTNGPVDITWSDAFGNVLLQQNAVQSGTVTFAGLAPGSYSVQVTTPEVCGMLASDFTISAPFVLEAAVQGLASASCPNTEDGQLDMLVLGGTAPYTYLWNTGAETEDLIAGAGDYQLTVTDANGCTWTSELLSIAAGEGPVAGIEAEATTVVNTEIAFVSTSPLAEEWAWDFGDGTTSTDPAPVHTYTLPGVYTVTLVVTFGDCSDETSFEVTVEQNVGVTPVVSGSTLRAWAMAEHIAVEHSLEGLVRIELMDATGRLHRQLSSSTGAGTILVPSNGLTNGVWFLRVTHQGEQRTLRVPVLR